jgi:hypothetical protein
LYGKSFRNFAGLPNKNSGAFMIKGSVQLKDIYEFRMAKPIPHEGSIGRLVPEVLIKEANKKVEYSIKDISRTNFLD